MLRTTAALQSVIESWIVGETLAGRKVSAGIRRQHTVLQVSSKIVIIAPKIVLREHCADKNGSKRSIFTNLRATSSKNRLKSIQEGRLEGLAQSLRKIWETLGRSKAIPKLPRGPKTLPQRVPKGAQERPKRVPKTIFECLNSFEMRLSRKCKNHQKCCNVLQNSRFGSYKSQQNSSSESIVATKMDSNRLHFR